MDNSNRNFLFGVIGVLVLIALVLSILPFTVIQAGERGVVLRWGQVNRVLDPGIHWVTPIAESVKEVDVTTVKEEVQASAASRDIQSVSSVIAVNYNVQPDKVAEIWTQFKGRHDDVVIAPAVQESVKAATAKYSAEELITKRELVKSDIFTSLKERLASNYIVVTNVSIVNFDFSSEFNAAIEAKVKAEQDALAAKNKLAQVEYEAEQRVATAEAEAQAIRLSSDAANNPRYVELKKLEVQLEYAKKWNGVLPVNMYASSPLPFVEITH